MIRVTFIIAAVLGLAWLVGGTGLGSAPARSGPTTAAAADPACYTDYTLRCTTDQYQRLAERNCVMVRAVGDDCRIETLPDGTEPHAVHVPSPSELEQQHQEAQNNARRLCDKFGRMGYTCGTVTTDP